MNQNLILITATKKKGAISKCSPKIFCSIPLGKCTFWTRATKQRPSSLYKMTQNKFNCWNCWAGPLFKSGSLPFIVYWYTFESIQSYLPRLSVCRMTEHLMDFDRAKQLEIRAILEIFLWLNISFTVVKQTEYRILIIILKICLILIRILKLFQQLTPTNDIIS